MLKFLGLLSALIKMMSIYIVARLKTQFDYFLKVY